MYWEAPQMYLRRCEFVLCIICSASQDLVVLIHDKSFLCQNGCLNSAQEHVMYTDGQRIHVSENCGCALVLVLCHIASIYLIPIPIIS